MRLSVLAAVLLAFAAGWSVKLLTQESHECVSPEELHALQMEAWFIEETQRRNTEREVLLYQQAQGLEVRYARWTSSLCE